MVKKNQTQSTRSNIVPPGDQDNPTPDLASEPLFTRVNPDENQTINPDDAWVTIEMNQYKYIEVTVAPNQTLHLTSKEFADAMQLYQERQAGINREFEVID